MKRHPTWLWLAGVAVLLIGAPPLLLWLIYPHEKPAPVELFFPDRISAAVRVTDLQSAWRRHWAARPGAVAPAAAQTDPDRALRALMEAFDAWPAWEKKYGATAAAWRLAAYQQAIFSLAGHEAWILFGEWNAPGPAPAPGRATAGQVGQIGLVLLLRGDNQVDKRVGPIAALLLGETRVTRSRQMGVTLYEYKAKHAERSITFAQVGGWLVASWYQPGLGPLPTIVARLREAQAAPAAHPANFPDFWPSADPLQGPPALAAVFYPKLYWGQLRQFAFQRHMASTADEEQSLARWQQRLDGVERINLVQIGRSLFDLRATITGPRPTLLQSQMNAASDPAPLAGDGSADRATTLTAPRGAAAALAAQLDLTLPMARSLAPIWGDSWEDWLDAMRKVEPFVPGLHATLAPHFTGADPSQRGRVGLAIYRSTVPAYPRLLFWQERPPYTLTPALPALTWAAIATADAATSATSATRLAAADGPRWLASNADFAPPTTATLGQSPAIAAGERFWQAAPFPPTAFLTLYFQPVLQDLDRFPKLLLSKKADRKKLDQIESLLRGFNLAVGDGLAVRLDLTPTEWIMKTKPI